MTRKTLSLRKFMERIKAESKQRRARFWKSEDGQIVRQRSKREQDRTQDGELGK